MVDIDDGGDTTTSLNNEAGLVYSTPITKFDELPDMQKNSPQHELGIQRVGITDLKIPIRMSKKGGGEEHTVANVNIFVDLDKFSKGTHMSRLAIGAFKFVNHSFNSETLMDIAEYIRQKCEAKTSNLIYKFPYFIERIAPISKEPGLIHCDCVFDIVKTKNECIFTMSIEATATSLCPCSREISEAGAHNQRSKIKITLVPKTDKWVWIEDIIDIAEDNSSCEIYSVLKRTDEKYVTEKAYNNPNFVEDMVRSVYNTLSLNDKLKSFIVEVTNEESIHQHNAYAMMDTTYGS